MVEIFPFFIVILAGLFFSEIFRRLHLPWVLALILGGVIVGPSGLKIIHENHIIAFLGEIGLIFLMFNAGLDTRFSSIIKNKKTIGPISILNSLIPFFAGSLIGLLLGYNTSTIIMLGILFISSSIAIIIPTLETYKLLNTRIGKSLLSSVIIEDILSLSLFAIFIHFLSPRTFISLPLFYILIILSIIGLRIVIPKIRSFFVADITGGDDLFEREIRIIFALLLGTVIFFEFLGLHSIIAGFFTGVVLSSSIKTKKLRHKLHTISYGLFVPIFFISAGLKININLFWENKNIFALIFLITVAFLLSKFLSGFLGAKLAGFTNAESSLIGSGTIPHLSTAFAIAFTGLEMGILKEEIVSAIIILSIVSLLSGPILTRAIAEQMVKKQI